MATVAEMPPADAIAIVEQSVDAIPKREPEGIHEVIDGQSVRKKVGARELRIANRLGRLLGNHVDDRGLGVVDIEMFIQLDPDARLKRRPDVTFVSADRCPIDRPIPDSETWWQVVPDLAVEVISPTELAVDMMAKMREDFEHGVRRVWLVFPDERCIYDYASPTNVRILAIGDEVDGGNQIPGFRLPLMSVFGG